MFFFCLILNCKFDIIRKKQEGLGLDEENEKDVNYVYGFKIVDYKHVHLNEAVVTPYVNVINEINTERDVVLTILYHGSDTDVDKLARHIRLQSKDKNELDNRATFILLAMNKVKHYEQRSKELIEALFDPNLIDNILRIHFSGWFDHSYSGIKLTSTVNQSKNKEKRIYANKLKDHLYLFFEMIDRLDLIELNKSSKKFKSYIKMTAFEFSKSDFILEIKNDKRSVMLKRSWILADAKTNPNRKIKQRKGRKQ